MCACMHTHSASQYNKNHVIMYNNKLIEGGPEKVIHHNYIANSKTWSQIILISNP